MGEERRTSEALVTSTGSSTSQVTREQHGNEFAERFKANITQDPGTGCWLWCGVVSSSGYGYVWYRERKKTVRAHRLSYEMSKGMIPPGQFICHTCDVPRCVNPDHLFAGTNSDNMQDALRKGRHTNQKPGHREHMRSIGDREDVKGSSNVKAFFTESDILEIFRLSFAGVPGLRIAAQFECDSSTIYGILKGRNYTSEGLKAKQALRYPQAQS